MTKISREEINKLIFDLDVDDEAIAEYLKIDTETSSPLNPQFVLNPDLVEISPEELELESAMNFGNALCRWRRQSRFLRAINGGDQRPVLVSEGDSWFQFPFLIRETIDHLDDDYLIWSLGAAGDTASNMTGSNREYLRGLNRWHDRVKGFLFSAAGNDVIGEDASGNPVLKNLLKEYHPGQSAAWHIDRGAFNPTLQKLKDAYLSVVGSIRQNQRFTDLPIFIHGYDYVFPYPHGQKDPRSPIWAAKDEWLGGPFKDRGFPEDGIRRDVIKIMIDALYDMMHDVAAADPSGRVFVVDARGSMPKLEDWADEIHGTKRGFREVADRFRVALQQHIV
ncbi:MAG: hypothetical protein QNJ67_07625 [Kiloniellales bacterium]|nr:hypothetical protein [Kiloniellales bacterium]